MVARAAKLVEDEGVSKCTSPCKAWSTAGIGVTGLDGWDGDLVCSMATTTTNSIIANCTHTHIHARTLLTDVICSATAAVATLPVVTRCYMV